MAARIISTSPNACLNEKMEQALTAEGLRMTIVRDGESLVDRLVDPEVQVAVLDSRRPGADVIDVLREAKRSGMEGECVVVCSADDVETCRLARQAGAREVVELPAEDEIIVQAVRLAAAHAERTRLLMDARRHRSRLRRLHQDMESDIRSALLIPRRSFSSGPWQVGTTVIQAREGPVDFSACHDLSSEITEALVGTQALDDGLDAVLRAARCKQIYLRASAGRHRDLPALWRALHAELEAAGFQDAIPDVTLLRLEHTSGRCAMLSTGPAAMAVYERARCEWSRPEWQPVDIRGEQKLHQWAGELHEGDALVLCSPGACDAEAHDRLLGLLWDAYDGSAEGLAERLVADVSRHAGGTDRLEADATALVARRRERGEGSGCANPSLRVDRRMEELLRVRAFCRELAAPALDEAETARLVLAADETMSNIVRHAGRPDMPVRVNGHRNHERVQVEFTYEGPGFQPKGAPSLPEDSGAVAETGYGLYIIDRSVDEVKYTRDGETNRILLAVHAKKRAEGERASAPDGGMPGAGNEKRTEP